MMDPFPNCFSIWVKAMSIALFLLFLSSAIFLSLLRDFEKTPSRPYHEDAHPLENVSMI
jgi:hypothetical protein